MVAGRGSRTPSVRYGSPHRLMRKRLEPLVATGTVPCARCGELIGAHELWELDHRDDGRGWLGPSHQRGNARAGWQAMVNQNAGSLRSSPTGGRTGGFRRRRSEPRSSSAAAWQRCMLAAVCGSRCQSWSRRRTCCWRQRRRVGLRSLSPWPHSAGPGMTTATKGSRRWRRFLGDAT